MKANIIDLSGNTSGQVELPPVFDEEYETKYSPDRVADKAGYKKLYNDRMDQRIAYLRKLNLSQEYVTALERLKL